MFGSVVLQDILVLKEPGGDLGSVLLDSFVGEVLLCRNDEDHPLLFINVIAAVCLVKRKSVNVEIVRELVQEVNGSSLDLRLRMNGLRQFARLPSSYLHWPSWLQD